MEEWLYCACTEDPMKIKDGVSNPLAIISHFLSESTAYKSVIYNPKPTPLSHNSTLLPNPIIPHYSPIPYPIPDS